ncbi:glucose transporter [Drepanopeziza brunnea f. sp. 'multigermtubi' MB_m1]|uniref:Glucose transporter n=1 Tax=Marssonina brunnea f. sp. multigermtubi (strain MB_m1) TaxID=1072389 RepID=K1WWH7_MARBU|nr:glucose transporter [Drepanopeziza brunnea f. sp. 'multigermtubi' MB_m1]EKD16852.1 glucose transporter [Drepanopeziza brunnea f. sp. 'multigermtubi' MB_m1]
MASPGLRQSVRDVTLYLVYLIFISTLGPLQFGYHLSELNAPQDVITCKNTSNVDELGSKPDSKLPQCIPMNEVEFAALSSMFVLGSFIGAITSGPIAGSYGRLLAMRITSVFFVVGSGLATLSGSVPMLSGGRFLAGIGAGASTVIVPIYISEVAPPKERGLFGSMTQVTINIGILITQSLGYYLSKDSLWRIILAVGAGLGLMQGIGLCFVPESPAWLASHKNPQQAVRTLQRIRGHGSSIAEEIEDWDVDRDVPEQERLLVDSEARGRRPSITSRAFSKSVAHVGFFQVIRDPFYRPAIIAVIGIMCAQQLCGINSIMMYSVSLLHGVLPITSSLLTIMISLVNLFTTVACAPLPDKIGRKACLLLSISGMGTMSLVLALALRWEFKFLSAISVLLFVAFFAGGLGPVPFMMASELVGTEAVGATQSWALGANYVATFLVAQFFPILNTFLNERFGGKGWVYFIFAVLAAASFVFVSWKVPETKGKKDPDEVWGRTRRAD